MTTPNATSNTAAALSFVNEATDYLLNGKEAVLKFVSTNFPQAITSNLVTVADIINNSGMAEILKSQGISVPVAGIILVGGFAGINIGKRPILYLPALAAGCLLAANKEQVAILGMAIFTGIFASAVTSLAGRIMPVRVG